jgi:hypothetical protein
MIPKSSKFDKILNGKKGFLNPVFFTVLDKHYLAFMVVHREKITVFQPGKRPNRSDGL